MYRKIRRETRLRGERKKCDFTKVALMIEGLSKKYLQRQSSSDRNHCFNFGKVYKGNKVEHVFKLDNQGNDTLEIKKVNHPADAPWQYFLITPFYLVIQERFTPSAGSCFSQLLIRPTGMEYRYYALE
jgi:hypothetical protein